MRCLAYLSCAAILVGCAKPDERATTDSAAGAAADVSAAGSSISAADVAGRWSMRATPLQTDSTLTTFQLVASSDTSQWTIIFPNRQPIPVHVVAIAGDSIVARFGPYESVLRKGVTVTTQTVSRLRDGKMVGTFVAGYATVGPDSVLQGRIEGTRAQ
jgi:hypothetical protein